MKKLLLLGAFALSTFAFANTSDVKSEISGKKEITKVQQLVFLKAWWGVSIVTPCGPVNVYFASNHADGTPEFIADLAYAINYSYDHCQPQLEIEMN